MCVSDEIQPSTLNVSVAHSAVGRERRVLLIGSRTVCVSTYTVPSPPTICFLRRLTRSRAFPAPATLTVV